MATAIRSDPLTLDDLLETPDDGQRYEMLDGELFVSPAPSRWHQEFLGDLYGLVYAHGEETGLGQCFSRRWTCGWVRTTSCSRA